MDYSRHLVLYSGGADSTYFIQQESTAKHLLHFSGMHRQRTLVALANAANLDRHVTVIATQPGQGSDGELGQVHALTDALMLLRASITAASFGMAGVVVCFNKDDLGVDTELVARLIHPVDPKFEICQPLISMSAADIRMGLKESKDPLPYSSCLVGDACGKCGKCLRGY